MKTIQDFEKFLGKRASDTTEDDLIKFFTETDFKEQTPHVIVDFLETLMDHVSNENFKKDIFSIRTASQLLEDEEIIDSIFSNYRLGKITRDELLNRIKQNFQSDDPIFVFSNMLCSMIALEDLNLSEEQDLIQSSTEKLEQIFKNFGSMENSYPIRCDLIDLIHQVREIYFERYNKEILNEKWISDEEDKLTDFEDEKIEEIPDCGIEPEELGYLDITKLKKENS